MDCRLSSETARSGRTKGTAMSVKMQKSNHLAKNLVRKNLQGMMEKQRIPTGNVEKLVDNPAELQKLLSTNGDKFDVQTKAAIAQLLGGVQATGGDTGHIQSSPFKAQSAQSLMIGEKTEAAQTDWWSALSQQTPASLPQFDNPSVDVVRVGDASISQADLEELLRNVTLQNTKSETPFVDATALLNVAQIQ